MRGSSDDMASEDDHAAANGDDMALEAGAEGVVGAVDNVLADDLRAIRRGRGLSLADVSARIGRSIGFLSQIERGLSTPSIEDLRRLAEVYQTPFSLFFGNPDADPADRGHIVRRERRRQLGSVEHGLVEELLSPDLSGDFEMLLSRFSPGAESTALHRAEIEEAGFVVSGMLEIEIERRWRCLEAGDSFRIRGEPFRWRNPGDATAVVIWVVAPPIY